MEKLFQKLMEMINDFINTVGLDKSFFFQLALAVILYFISKELFLKEYLENFKKSEQLTKGRMIQNKDLEDKIEKRKDLYEQTAKRVHTEFQKVFDEMRATTQKKHQKDTLNLQKEQKDLMKKQRTMLKQSLEEQEHQIQKELPFLVNLLVEKMKG